MIEDSLQRQKEKENESGCCLRRDRRDTLCTQVVESECSKITSYFVKWDGPGPVCGLQKDFCKDPFPTVWPKNITDWPICEQRLEVRNVTKQYNYMTCEVSGKYWCLVFAKSFITLLGRPCCVGIYGKCMLASKEHCDFVKGTYHPAAHLCSQVDCMENVCSASFFKQVQIIRLFSSLFIQAGWIQFAMTAIFKYFIMHPMEVSLGTRNMAMLYIVSGVGGNLLSSLVYPLAPDSGCIASLFGVFFFSLYKMFTLREKYLPIYLRPRFLFYLVTLFIVILLTFLLPWMDITIVLGGSLSGFIFLLVRQPNRKRSHNIVAMFSILIILIMFLILLLLPSNLIDLPMWSGLLCYPLFSGLCENMTTTVNQIKMNY